MVTRNAPLGVELLLLLLLVVMSVHWLLQPLLLLLLLLLLHCWLLRWGLLLWHAFYPITTLLLLPLLLLPRLPVRPGMRS